MKFPKSYGGTGIVIPVKNTPQEQIKQESGGFIALDSGFCHLANTLVLAK